jgi:hypothetical protein
MDGGIVRPPRDCRARRSGADGIGAVQEAAPIGSAPFKRKGNPTMAAPQAYCVKCKSKREMKDAVQITMKNGRPATEGKCPVCGTKMFKIGAA